MEEFIIKGEFTSQDVQPRREAKITRTPPRRIRRRGAARGKTRKKHCVRLAICITVACLSLLIAYSEAPFAKSVRAFAEKTIEYGINIKETGIYQALFPNAEAVFGAGQKLSYPVIGTLSRDFSANHRNVTFVSDTQDVKAALEGTVTKRGISDEYGNYIRLEHANGMETVYYGLKYSELDRGYTVERGDTVGTLFNDCTLVFEFTVNGKYKDPLRYFEAPSEPEGK